MTLPDDPIILELLPEFLDTWIGELSSLYPALVASKNSQDLYRMGHTIKGSCAQFGLDDISQLGIELMGYARNSEWEKAAALRTKIEAAFLSVREYVSSL